MEGKELSKDPTCAHTHCLKWLRRELTHLTSKGVWGHVPVWIGHKFGQLIPLFMIYLLVKVRGNLMSVQ